LLGRSMARGLNFFFLSLSLSLSLHLLFGLVVEGVFSTLDSTSGTTFLSHLIPCRDSHTLLSIDHCVTLTHSLPSRMDVTRAVTVEFRRGRRDAEFSTLLRVPHDETLEYVFNLAIGVAEETMDLAWAAPASVRSALVSSDGTLPEKTRRLTFAKSQFETRLSDILCFNNFLFQWDDVPAPSRAQNAFDLLKRPRREKSFLTVEDFNAGRTGPNRVAVVLCEYLRSRECEISESNKSLAKNCFNNILAVFFAADPHWEGKIWDRAPALDKAVGGGLLSMKEFGFIGQDGPLFNTEEVQSKAKGRKRVTRADLESWARRLESAIPTYPFSLTHVRAYVDLREGISAVIRAFRSYIKYLDEQDGRNSASRHDLLPCVQRHENNVFERRDAISVSKIDDGQKKLEDLVPRDPYEPLLISDIEWIRSMDRGRRFEFYKNLHLSFPIGFFSHTFGGQVQNAVYIWRVIQGAPDQDIQCNTVVNRLIIPQLHEFASREYTRTFLTFAHRLRIGALPSQLKELIHQAANVVPESYSPLLEERLLWLLSLDEYEVQDEFATELVLDQRHGTAKRDLSQWWDLVAKKLQEDCATGVDVDKRRHDDLDASEARVAGSIEALYDDCVSAAREKNIAICSSTWFKYAFTSPNPRIHSRHFAELPFVLVRGIKKNLRKPHPDQHYGHAIWRDVDWYYVTGPGRGKTTVISLDDKAKVKVGCPGVATVAIQAQRPVVVSGSRSIGAADHDIGTTSITPSVTLLVEPPNASGGSLCRGRLSVSLHESVTRPSTPMRHAAQFLTDTFKNVLGGAIKDLLIFKTDSGGDHNVAFAKVIVSYYLIFMCLLSEGLVSLMALGTVGGQSWINPVERSMSVINYGLYGLTLARSSAPEGWETHFKGKTMKELRDFFTRGDVATDASQAAWRKTLAPSLDRLRESIGALRYCDNEVHIVSEETEASLEGKVNQMSDLFKKEFGLDYTTLTNKALDECQKWREFRDSHVEATSLLLRFYRCGREELCIFCKRGRRLTDEQLKHWYFRRPSFRLIKEPWPFPSDDANRIGHYLPLADLLGRTALVAAKFARPSEKSLDKAVSALPQDLREYYSFKNARGIVFCRQCDKPRLIYGSRILTQTEQEDLSTDVCDADYVCSSKCIQEATSHLVETGRSGTKKGKQRGSIFFVHPGLTCSSLIESNFYKFVFGGLMERATSLNLGASAFSKEALFCRCVYCGHKTGSLPKANKMPDFLPSCQSCKEKSPVKSNMKFLASPGALVEEEDEADIEEKDVNEDGDEAAHNE
jgi:hypothetical protein